MIVLFKRCHVLFIHTPLLCSSTSLFLTTIFASTELNHQLVQIRVIATSKPRQTKGVMLISIILKSCSAIVLSMKEMFDICESIPKYRPTERFKNLSAIRMLWDTGTQKTRKFLKMSQSTVIRRLVAIKARFRLYSNIYLQQKHFWGMKLFLLYFSIFLCWQCYFIQLV